MNAQHAHDYLINPTLGMINKPGFNSPLIRRLLLCTMAIESDMGQYLKQIGGGPAMCVYQMEPDTEQDILHECDIINSNRCNIGTILDDLLCGLPNGNAGEQLAASQVYATLMARCKYWMDTEPLPEDTPEAMYKYYKRIYNTPDGASTFGKFLDAIDKHKVFEVELYKGTD